MRFRILSSILLTGFAFAWFACDRQHDNDDFSPTAPGFTEALTLSVASDSIPADGFTRVRVTARITAEAPTNRRKVLFQTTDGQFIDPDAPADLKTKSADVDAQGAVTVELRSGTTPKVATITAKVLDSVTSKEVPGLLARITVEFTPPRPVEVIKVGTSADTVEADNATQLFIYADIAPGLPEGSRTVMFETTLGTFVGGDKVVMKDADRSHRATAVLKSAEAGEARITAKISETTDATFVRFVAATPDLILVRLDKTKLTRGGDEEAMVTVTLSRNPGRGSVTPKTVVSYSAFDKATGRSLDPAFRNQEPSNDAGEATAKLLLGSLDFVGTATIRAQVGGVTGEEDIEIDAPAPRPDIAVTPAILDFGEVVVGTSAEKAVTVSNGGPSALTIQSLKVTGAGFTLENTPPLPFIIEKADETLPVTVKFTPTAEGARSGTLVITSNDPDEGTLTMVLTGTGKAASQARSWRP
jgi:Abnormal spindle-like microcephaly-assoc'd, ASPM-SPD-2-Hydin